MVTSSCSKTRRNLNRMDRIDTNIQQLVASSLQTQQKSEISSGGAMSFTAIGGGTTDEAVHGVTPAFIMHCRLPLLVIHTTCRSMAGGIFQFFYIFNKLLLFSFNFRSWALHY